MLTDKVKLRIPCTQVADMKDIVAIEVGVFLGGHAEAMLEGLDIKKLYCIDPYPPYKSYTQQHQDEFYEAAKARLAPFGSRVELWRKTASAAAGMFCDGSIDLVYIDGDHSYPFVSADIRNYFPLVRSGGLLAGHDYKIESSGNGVIQATKEFSEETGLEVCTGGKWGWWVWKP